jgi:GNAT superfamily N-acetyltransferase
MLSHESLELLIAHEVAYAEMVAQCERTAHAWFLHAEGAPAYGDANRALRLRCAGAGPDTVAREVVDYYAAIGQTPIADVDHVAQAQGIGEALQRLGMTPVTGSRLLMRYGSTMPPPAEPASVSVETVPNETGAGEAAEWIDVAISDDVGWPDEHLWRAIAGFEARYDSCTLYLARLDGRAVGACDLFESARWGRVDSVVTRPEWRRRGVASALVARAVADSLTSGNFETYLFTEPGGVAERLYRRLGFVPWQLDAMRRYRG